MSDWHLKRVSASYYKITTDRTTVGTIVKTGEKWFGVLNHDGAQVRKEGPDPDFIFQEMVRETNNAIAHRWGYANASAMLEAIEKRHQARRAALNDALAAMGSSFRIRPRKRRYLV